MKCLTNFHVHRFLDIYVFLALLHSLSTTLCTQYLVAYVVLMYGRIRAEVAKVFGQ